jgi:hypothetical protein
MDIENAKFWCACTKCREVKHYYVHEDGTTTFPRGEYLAHGLRSDYITTGFDSEQKAQEFLQKQLAILAGNHN